MTARDDIHSMLDHVLTEVGHIRLDELLDKHVHEATDEARDYFGVDGAPSRLGRREHHGAYLAGITAAIRIIDPESETT